MWKSTATSICPLCRFVSASSKHQALAGPAYQPWATGRFMSGQRQRGGKRSSMSLSRDVARPRILRDSADRPPRRQAGPFGGMNRTVANIDPAKQKPHAASRSRTGRDGATKGKDDDRSDGFKALKMQRALVSLPHGQRTRLKAQMEAFESFDSFKLLPSVQEAITSDALKGLVDIKPTPVQRLAIPALLGQVLKPKSATRGAKSNREEFLLAAETGSGKTLAYLVPCINALKKAEAEDEQLARYWERVAIEKQRREESNYRGPKDLEPHPYMSRPRVVVLVPSGELVDQVGAVAKSLAHKIKFKSERASATMNAATIQRSLYSTGGLDLLVATPQLLAHVAKSDPNILSRVTHLVIDEADSLLGKSFEKPTTAILDRVRPSLKQLIMCSATIPRGLNNHLASEYPDMWRITTPNLHAIPRRVQLGVIDVGRDPYMGNKDLACADAIWSIGKEAARHDGPVRTEMEIKQVLVFVNEREKTEELAEFLRGKGIDAVAMHRDSAEARQPGALASFKSWSPLTVEREDPAAASEKVQKAATPAVKTGKRMLPNIKVVVATDLLSRGVDTLAVRHVVLYDVPNTTIDFIHRLGRAGRMGRRGRGIVLVGKDDKKDVVAAVKESMFMGQALI